jgi:hypothetical protein
MASGMEEFIQRPSIDGWAPGNDSLEERTFTETATAPDDLIRAAPRLEPGLGDTVIGWEPRVEPDESGGVRIRYPERGDRCAVREDDNGNYWVLGWTPYG